MREYCCERPNPNEGESITRLHLHEDGTFVYSDEWRTWGWHVGSDARGKWEQHGETLTMHVEETEIYGMQVPCDIVARQEGDGYRLDQWTLLLPRGTPS